MNTLKLTNIANKCYKFNTYTKLYTCKATTSTMQTINSNNICQFSTSNDFKNKHCVPCEGGVSPLDENLKLSYLENVDKEWKLIDENKKITRKWRLPFPKSIEYLNSISKIAEEEGHHPDISIDNYWNFNITIFTHAINNLTENDYILASKIDALDIKSVEPRKKKAPTTTTTTTTPQ